MGPNQVEVFEKVKDVLIDSLGVDDDEVTTSATLQGDLGAESIDLLDIVFQIEKAFSIKIPKDELMSSEIADILENPDFVSGDRLTPSGLEKLRSAMPHADFTEFEQDPSVAKMPELLTVGTIVKLVESKLAAA